MKRFGFTVSFSALLLTTVAAIGQTDGRFHQTLPVGREIVHVLNRLTFGPRPGDLEQVRQKSDQVFPGYQRADSIGLLRT